MTRVIHPMHYKSEKVGANALFHAPLWLASHSAAPRLRRSGACRYRKRRFPVKTAYLRPGFDFNLAHAIEEAGEFLAAAGKTQRWGPESYNPELPPAERESNRDWLMREMSDLEGALNRLWNELGGRPI